MVWSEVNLFCDINIGSIFCAFSFHLIFSSFRQKSDTKPVAPAHPTSADNWGPHELLRRKTVMEIAMAAHATNPNEPNIKIVSPYPGRLLKARLRRIQKVNYRIDMTKFNNRLKY